MKTYQITIQIEEIKKKSSYVSRIADEVADEKRQMKIAEDLNRAANEVREAYFQELLETINEELSELGVSKFQLKTAYNKWNQAWLFESTLVQIGGEYFRLILSPKSDVNAGHPTKYMTSTKSFDIQIKKGERDAWPLKSDDVVGNFFSTLEHYIKIELHNK